MSAESDRELIRKIIEGNRYLCLSTTDGVDPWVAPLEYMHDEHLNFYFLSTEDCRHARHIGRNPTVAITIFDTTQPEYSTDLTATLRGVQIRASATRLAPEEHPEIVSDAIDALQPPMPPYQVFRATPTTFYLPRVVDGVNERVEVEMSRLA